MLEGRTYVPLLHVRLAEMRALRELPNSVKNLIFPVIKIRPWLNSKKLSKSLDVIADSFGTRLFGLDLDESKLDSENQRPAYKDFADLFLEAGSFSNYYAFVADGVNRVPVIRRSGAVTPFKKGQIDHAKSIDRGLVFRVSPFLLGDYLEFIELCALSGARNVVVVIDCGWAVDVLAQASACVSIAEKIVQKSDEVDIVISGSSFPDDFAKMGNRKVFPLSERLLYHNVRKNVNFPRLFYGDWGSTRPPTDPIPMSSVPPRIDMAGRDQWYAWRSEGGEAYKDIAKRVMIDPAWASHTGLWGNYMIESTAQGEEASIKSPAMAAAVRINLHLNAQATYDNPHGIVIEDEPVGEDL